MDETHPILEADFKVFEAHRKEWLNEHEGQHVVICAGIVVGFFDNYADGLRAGITKFGVNSEFLIQQISSEEPVFVIY
jgi:hypothetical protein